jgi:hypothetical protein
MAKKFQSNTPSQPAVTAAPAQSERVYSMQELAYFSWKKRGCPHGSDWIDWFEAKKEHEKQAQRIAARKR